MAGLHINAVTYVCLVISIGLIVDFLMHVLLRYFECKHQSREERVKETLSSMGSSILLGGLSTLLGVLPLIFSTSTILSTVFTLFCSMVILGCGHGLVFLPVVLSIFGPLPNATGPASSGGSTSGEDSEKEEKTSTAHVYGSDASDDGNPVTVKQEKDFIFRVAPSKWDMDDFDEVISV